MVADLSLMLWVIALALNVQIRAQACTGECPEGYRSVCVQRGSDCNCSCVKDVAAGAAELRKQLERYEVSSTTIDDAVRQYREFAGESTEAFSFTVEDRGRTFTIRGGIGAKQRATRHTIGRITAAELVFRLAQKKVRSNYDFDVDLAQGSIKRHNPRRRYNDIFGHSRCAPEENLCSRQITFNLT